METTCGVYLYDLSTGQILIGHVTNTEHAFSIPKGMCDESDKDYYSAAIRELYEETDVDITTLNVLYQTELDFVVYKNKPKRLKPFLICIESIGDKEVKCTSMFTNEKGEKQPEIDWFKWLTLTDSEAFLPASQLVLLPRLKEIISNINIVNYE